MADSPPAIKLPTVPAAPPRCFMGCGRRVLVMGEICQICWDEE